MMALGTKGLRPGLGAVEELREFVQPPRRAAERETFACLCNFAANWSVSFGWLSLIDANWRFVLAKPSGGLVVRPPTRRFATPLASAPTGCFRRNKTLRLAGWSRRPASCRRNSQQFSPAEATGEQRFLDWRPRMRRASELAGERLPLASYRQPQ